MHELSEQTRRLIDWALTGFAAAAAAAGALTLSDVALIVTIGAGLMSIAWQAMRFRDRFKYGPAADAE